MTADITVYIVVFVGVLLLATLSTPWARWVGLRLHAIDQPDPTRKVHTVPTPRLGGIAIFASILIAALLLRGVYSELGSILIGATLVSFLGFWDDRFTLSVVIKLAGQLFAAGLLILTGVQFTALPFSLLNIIVTIFWVVGITNAFNLLDNMDGLSAGIAAIASAHFALMCALTGQYLVGALAVAVMAACIGFLIYNWNPATIFMGDSGSLFLGFLLASVGIKLRFPDNVAFVTWMIPVLVLGIPLFDTALVTVSRLRRRMNPLTTPGVDHTSHRLTYAGFSRREAVFLLYIASFLLGLTAIFVTQASVIDGYLVGGSVALTGLLVLWRFERPPFWAGEAPLPAGEH
jgi:UDP-GlcNAc:undecaprenyl-phosphate/decaprenyl-phosphate GlcNAc-1-phosphate transferase